MTPRRYTVTAALPYANGRLHVGQIAGAYLPADIFVRYLRSHGDEVAFICGSDDYGVPVALAARKEGKTPAEIAAFYREEQEAEFNGLGVSFDIYSGTSVAPHHADISQEIFSKLHEHGFLEKRTSHRLYDPEVDMFLADRYVEGICHHCGADGARGDQCEACGKPIDPTLLIAPRSMVSAAKPEVRETVHWYFKLPEFEQKLRERIEAHPEWRPMVRNFCLGLLDEGLPERSITRDLSWGVPVPLPDDPDAEGKVLYVWFDAPIGYVSFTAQWCAEQGGDWKDYEKWWKAPDTRIVHFIGEDNVVFHCVIWPAMLMGEGSYELPSDVPANCFLNIQFPGKDVEKMSTSRGSAVWVGEYLKTFDPDPLRYYLTMVAPEHQRTAFQFEALVTRNNHELVAALGNFIHRNMTFTHKYFDGVVPPQGELTDEDRAQLALVDGLADRIGELIEGYHFRDAMTEIMATARASNKYIDTRAPWTLRKSDLEACGTVLNVCLNTIKALAVVFEPFMPFGTEKVREMLACSPDELKWCEAATPLPAGRKLGEPVVLFSKMEEAEEE